MFSNPCVHKRFNLRISKVLEVQSLREVVENSKDEYLVLKISLLNSGNENLREQVIAGMVTLISEKVIGSKLFKHLGDPIDNKFSENQDFIISKLLCMKIFALIKRRVDSDIICLLRYCGSFFLIFSTYE